MRICFLFLLSFFTFNLSCHAMAGEEEEGTHVVKQIKGKTISELQQIQATISYPFIPQSLGNMIQVNKKGELKVACPGKRNEEAVHSLYTELDSTINTGYVMESIDITAESQSHLGALCKGKRRLNLVAENTFIGEQAIFGSEGEIKFMSPTFQFSSSFIEVDPSTTTITFSPPEELHSPILSLVYKPVQSPVFIQGKIDFTTLSFEDFIVSHAELNINFKK